MNLKLPWGLGDERLLPPELLRERKLISARPTVQQIEVNRMKSLFGVKDHIFVRDHEPS